MRQLLFLAQIFNAADIIDVVQKSYSWGITVLIFGTAALLAVSLVSWLIHRS